MRACVCVLYVCVCCKNACMCLCIRDYIYYRFCKHMAAVVAYKNRMNGNRVERNKDIYDFVKPIHTTDNCNKMKAAILKFPLKEIDIDALLDGINTEQKNINRILPPPIEKYKDNYCAVKKFLDKKLRIRKPGPKPSRRMRIGAGEGSLTHIRAKIHTYNLDQYKTKI